MKMWEILESDQCFVFISECLDCEKSSQRDHVFCNTSGNPHVISTWSVRKVTKPDQIYLRESILGRDPINAWTVAKVAYRDHMSLKMGEFTQDLSFCDLGSKTVEKLGG